MPVPAKIWRGNRGLRESCKKALISSTHEKNLGNCCRSAGFRLFLHKTSRNWHKILHPCRILVFGTGHQGEYCIFAAILDRGRCYQSPRLTAASASACTSAFATNVDSSSLRILISDDRYTDRESGKFPQPEVKAIKLLSCTQVLAILVSREATIPRRALPDRANCQSASSHRPDPLHSGLGTRYHP